MISMTNAIGRIRSKGYFSLLLLSTAFMSIASAQAQQDPYNGITFAVSSASPAINQAVTITVTTSTDFPTSVPISYTVGEYQPQSAPRSSGSLQITNHTGTTVVGPFATPGLYSFSVLDYTIPTSTAGLLPVYAEVHLNVGGYVLPDALKGQQVFYLSGQEQLPGGGSELEAIAGSFTGDGYGHITSGVLDKNSGSGLVQVSQLTGTYTIDANTGKGSVTLQLPGGPLSFSFYTEIPLSEPIHSDFHSSAIVAGGGSLLSASGQLSGAEPTSYALSDTNFTINGEGSSAGDPVSGIASLQLSNAPKVTGRAELIENGTASLHLNITGTATAVDPVTGRFTMSLTGLGGETENFAVYRGGFKTGATIFVSLNPHSTSPLLLGTNGVSQPSYVIGMF